MDQNELAKTARMALPFFASGTVVHGFGRGSKELGVPTANLADEVVDNLPDQLTCGVYCGFASVNHGTVYPMCLSIGWNPYYKNEKRTMETHIMHSFDKDFYGEILKIVIVEYIRPMLDFKSLEELKLAISSDIRISTEKLLEEKCAEFSKHKFFCPPE